ncbi:MAG: tetratricopeptide repeat protein [Lewinellaceae bacterium]|nr:tetratricopeptide repeat protein [Lewinellaceae bacterium]
MAYLQQSLKIQQEIGDRQGEGTTLNNISQIHQVRGDYDTALAYLQQSLKIRQEIGDTKGLAENMHNIGALFLHKTNWKMRCLFLYKPILFLKKSALQMHGCLKVTSTPSLKKSAKRVFRRSYRT